MDAWLKDSEVMNFKAGSISRCSDIWKDTAASVEVGL